MQFYISGIQQVGIGNPDVHKAFKWYSKNFGMDIPVFEEAAEANLMLPYTAGMPHQRHAILAVNLMGGGGFEIWQYTSRTPQAPLFEVQAGDLGLYITKMKSPDVKAAYNQMRSNGLNVISPLVKDPNEGEHFFVKDLYENIFQVVSSDNWFTHTGALTGGPYGMIIGVSDMEQSIKFYSNILGYDTVVYDSSGNQNDLSSLPGGKGNFRRVLLRHSKARVGSFSEVLGKSEIELIQVLDRSPHKIFEGRLWGDMGFIHLCFDIINMKALKAFCAKEGSPFTVDGGEGFEMGEAAGHFAYIEDPDGALIEFVETKKIPILKKIGWYLDLKKRDVRKPLPRWMLKTLRFNRVKD
jgi:catechol 2,3-dioxygenase-like lactoylglutathione lyase family enzyme